MGFFHRTSKPDSREKVVDKGFEMLNETIGKLMREYSDTKTQNGRLLESIHNYAEMLKYAHAGTSIYTVEEVIKMMESHNL